MSPRALLVRACLLAGLIAGTLPTVAAGHAVLTHSSPHRGDAVAFAPPQVLFDFNEPVAASPGSLRVYSPEGERVDRSDVIRPGTGGKSVAVSLPSEVADGIYTATYRIVSADGHPVSGGFAFTIGTPPPDAARTAPTVASLLEQSEAGPALEGLYGVARGMHYLVLLMLLGTVALLGIFWPASAGEPRWPRRTLVAATGVAVVCCAIGFVAQGALATGVGLADALGRPSLDSAIDSRVGQAWLIRAGLWTLVLGALILGGRPWRAPALSVLGVGIATSLPLAGHAETQSPRAVLMTADLVHVLAAGVWLGGLVALLVAYWPRREAADDAATATALFSRAALPAIGVLVVAGSVQAWFYLDGLSGFTEGSYGIALLAKIGLLVLILIFAAANRRRVVRLREAAGDVTRRLRTAMRAEVALAVLVLAATAVVARSEPPATLAAGPSISELDLGPMRLEMWIEPARRGPNDFHLYFFDRVTGAQIDSVKQATVTLTKPDSDIPPIKLRIPRKNAAHYELLDQAIGLTGKWEVRVAARISDFDAYEATTTIEIREEE